MRDTKICEEDLALLKAVYPDLEFEDPERRAVLLENETRDINAAPGSGKTSILAAKLYLLARKWPYARKGICVISHTNVAQNEIKRRLASTTEGARLLSYPHFIGTIHSFINQFLSLPLLRSVGIEIEIIDNEVFAKRALTLARSNSVLRTWMEKDSSVGDMISTLVYKGPDLELSSEVGSLPKETSKSYPILANIKEALTCKGVFRFEDMFAFAESLIAQNPSIRDGISNRFPALFIDEMQDTSWDQEDLLTRLFNSSVVQQRYGDINQQILGSDKNSEKLTFPKENHLSISTSKRFGSEIARAVSAVQLQGEPVVGDRETNHKPILILYDEKTLTSVISHFGEVVLDLFSDDELKSGSINALCYRKKGGGQVNPGRHLGDYWPPFASEVESSVPRAENLWSLLSTPREMNSSGFKHSNRVTSVRKAILIVLKAANSTVTRDIQDGSQLWRKLHLEGFETNKLKLLCRDLVLSGNLIEGASNLNHIVELLHPVLIPFLPEDMALEEFSTLNVFKSPAPQFPSEGEGKNCRVKKGDREVNIRIGTVASMKGETHLASLVLESYGGQSRRFDLKEALPAISGRSLLPEASKLLTIQFRNLYVSMSRPSHLLCLAMNRSRADERSISELADRGWSIQEL